MQTATRAFNKLHPIKVYFDYRSPFSYLCKDPLYQVERDYQVEIQWLPYQFPMDDVVGNLSTRSELQWRKVKYFYLDARRFANERGIRLLGPKRIFDSTSANIGALFTQNKHGRQVFEKYHDRVFELFFLRELDLEDLDALVQVMNESEGINVKREEFEEYIQGEGKSEFERINQMGDQDGIFGVPSTVVEGELFFGNDRVEWVRKKLDKLGLKKGVSEL